MESKLDAVHFPCQDQVKRSEHTLNSKRHVRHFMGIELSYLGEPAAKGTQSLKLAWLPSRSPMSTGLVRAGARSDCIK